MHALFSTFIFSDSSAKTVEIGQDLRELVKYRAHILWTVAKCRSIVLA